MTSLAKLPNEVISASFKSYDICLFNNSKMYQNVAIEKVAIALFFFKVFNYEVKISATIKADAIEFGINVS